MGILEKKRRPHGRPPFQFQKDCAQDKRVSPRRARPERAIPPAKEFHHSMHPVHPQRLLRCIRNATFGSPPFHPEIWSRYFSTKPFIPYPQDYVKEIPPIQRGKLFILLTRDSFIVVPIQRSGVRVRVNISQYIKKGRKMENGDQR